MNAVPTSDYDLKIVGTFASRGLGYGVTCGPICGMIYGFIVFPFSFSLLPFGALLGAIFGSILGCGIAILLGIATLIVYPKTVYRPRLYKIIIISLAVIFTSVIGYSAFFQFLAEFSVTGEVDTNIPLLGAIIASIAAGIFGYRISTRQVNWKEKKKGLPLTSKENNDQFTPA